MTLNPYVKAVGQRMIRAAASAMLSVAVVGGGVLNAFDADWTNVVGVGAGAAFVSLLLSLSGQLTTGNGPAFGDVEQVAPAYEPDPPAGEHGTVELLSVLLILTVVNTICVVLLLCRVHLGG
jgi:hypothetical protein